MSMTPKEMKVSMIKELEQSYNLNKADAIEMAMFAVDRVINYSRLYDNMFWMELMEELDNDSLTRK
ncbi:MAG: hypothetical protein RIQ51_1781 [Bacteroidota bacterium]